MNSYNFLYWLAGHFGFNGPLRQYFSLYQAPRERRKKREVIDERKKSKQPPPASTASAVGPGPSIIPWDALTLEVYPAPPHHPTTPTMLVLEKRQGCLLEQGIQNMVIVAS